MSSAGIAPTGPLPGDSDYMDDTDDAQHNIALGWCPCGLERNVDCECFGTYALAVCQGLTPVQVTRTEGPDVRLPE